MLTRAAATMPSPVIHAKVVFERYNVRAHSTRLQSPEGVKSPRGMRRSEFVTRDSGGGWVVTVHAPTGSLDAGWDPWMQIWPLQHLGAQRPRFGETLTYFGGRSSACPWGRDRAYGRIKG